MIRLLATVALVATLLPAGAEAAKLRSGGSRSSHVHAETREGGNTTIITPRIGNSVKPVEAKTSAPTHPPFPAPASSAASTEPVLLKVTAGEPPKPWCRSEVVVGGFCILN